jgi:hypothetical protein
VVLHLLPLPAFEIDVPDDTELLRNAHTGTIMNGLRDGDAGAQPTTPVQRTPGQVVLPGLGRDALGQHHRYLRVYAPRRGLQPVATGRTCSPTEFYAAVVGASIATHLLDERHRRRQGPSVDV